MRYIGNKTRLLDQVTGAISEYAPDAQSICDLFSGTASVARRLKQDGYAVSSNDLLYFSYCLQFATIENDSVPSYEKLAAEIGANPFEWLNGMPISDLESLPQEKRFFQNHYSPHGGRMYLTDENALRLDFARTKIDEWTAAGLIDQAERMYLVAGVVEGLPFVSNITGTYGAYSKKWDKRAFKTFQLVELEVPSNGLDNHSYNEDGTVLLKRISGDVLYLDPPYNGRQYLPNYHLLETAARYDYPELRGVTGQRPTGSGKSDFCLKRKAVPALETVIASAQFRHIVMSYNTEGIMSLSDIRAVMERYGKPGTFDVKRIPYRRFKSHEQADDNSLCELIIHIEKEI